MQSLIRATAASTPAMLAIFGDETLLASALRFESELARAEAEEGLIPRDAALLIERCCLEPIDIAALASEAAHAGTLAIPLVALLRARVAAVDPAAAKHVHRGGTSQDVADTALMLQAKAACALLAIDGRRLCDALAALARRHADTLMIGRTLLQSALPITFGLKAAQWLLAVDAALTRVRREAESGLALQFGGATGSLTDLDGRAFTVAERLAASLGLANPALPWQARREGLAGLSSALAIMVGSLGKIARDVSLLGQNEIAEAFEPRAPGRGGSSAMAHKRNPTGCQVALSAALRAPGLAATIMAALPQEHERGLGGWQAEAPVIADLFCLAHGGLAAMIPVVEGLEIDAGAMARNLAAADVGSDPGESVAMTHRALSLYEKTR